VSEADYSGVRDGGRWVGTTGSALAALGILILVSILVGMAVLYYVLVTALGSD
jgi:hypothetical protein